MQIFSSHAYLVSLLNAALSSVRQNLAQQLLYFLCPFTHRWNAFVSRTMKLLALEVCFFARHITNQYAKIFVKVMVNISITYLCFRKVSRRRSFKVKFICGFFLFNQSCDYLTMITTEQGNHAIQTRNCGD